MSAERLRQAAQMLREMASEEPSPWPCRSYIKTAIRHIERNCDLECHHGVWNDTEERWDDPGCPQPDGHWDRYTTGAYVATMHPGVGLALVQLLENEAHAMDAASVRVDTFHLPPPYNHARAAMLTEIADAILGGAS